jgi:hypothetical protein
MMNFKYNKNGIKYELGRLEEDNLFLLYLEIKEIDYVVSFQYNQDEDEIEDIFIENIDRLDEDEIFNAHMYTNLLDKDLKAICNAMLIIENDEEEEE